MLAILVLPASPSSVAYLSGNPDRIRASVAEATTSGGDRQQFGDYLLMYSALAGEQERAAALQQATTLRREVGRRRQQPGLHDGVADGPEEVATSLRVGS